MKKSKIPTDRRQLKSGLTPFTICGKLYVYTVCVAARVLQQPAESAVRRFRPLLQAN